MSTNLSSFAYQPGNNAAFQACVQAIDNFITGTAGWPLTADTGMIDPTTVAKPAANADAGYRIYKTNDGLTTYNLKIIYGLDASGDLRLKFSMGTGTNGTGTLTGQTSGTFTWDWIVPPTSPTNLAMSGAGGRLMIFIGIYNGNRSCNGISIHRTVDNVGAMNDDGMEIFFCPSNAGLSCQYLPKTGTVPPLETPGPRFPCVFTAGATGVVGGSLRFGHPMLWGESGAANNPTLAVMHWAANDFSPVSTTTHDLTVYSATRTYLLDADLHNLSSNTRIGWRYE